MLWIQLGEVAPEELENSRLQLHWASQIPAAIGFTFAEPVPDWSHTSLSWNGKRKMLIGSKVGQDGIRAGIDLAALEIVLVMPDGESRLPLLGQTLDDGYAWIADAVSGAKSSGQPSINRPNHELPAHPVSAGAAFDAPGKDRSELSNWFANAHRILSAVAATQSNASPVRCWPHHFDIATLVSLDTDKDPEDARSIGIGLSPGDQGISEPYFYVTPWPPPDVALLPDLPAGSWNRKGWVGAVLKGTEVVAQAGKRQRETVDHFIDAAAAASRRLLEAVG